MCCYGCGVHVPQELLELVGSTFSRVGLVGLVGSVGLGLGKGGEEGTTATIASGFISLASTRDPSREFDMVL